MYTLKLLAGLAALGLSFAVVTAVAGVTPKGETVVSVPLAKGDRLDIHTANASCVPNQWPYGCQWQPAAAVPVRRHVKTAYDVGHRGHPRESVSQWRHRLASSQRVF